MKGGHCVRCQDHRAHGDVDGQLRGRLPAGLTKAGETIRNIQGAWVDGQEVIVESGAVKEFHVHLKVTFVLD